MNSDTLKGKWKQLRGHVKAEWGKLTDQDLTEIDGNIDMLVGKLQELYGEARETLRDKVVALTAKARDGAREVTKALDSARH
ncbi:MAG: CsbD family protein [Deltaproteobacteria bacterium]|jgi:uncharacterized protein YjbJ (UPF0337 family)|nr:CsbD family protein [Deltaproteobacteria bacterium]